MEARARRELKRERKNRKERKGRNLVHKRAKGGTMEAEIIKKIDRFLKRAQKRVWMVGLALYPRVFLPNMRILSSN